MTPQETRAWAYATDWELGDQDEDDALLAMCDWPTLIECAADPSCPKADLIESSLAVAIIELVRSHRGVEALDAVHDQVTKTPSRALSEIREALTLYERWRSPTPLANDECDGLAKRLLMWVDHPLSKFNRTGHVFNDFIEYSMHNSSAGLVFIYIHPPSGQWVYGRSARYPELDSHQPAA